MSEAASSEVNRDDIDVATEILYRSVVESPVHGPVIRQIEALRDRHHPGKLHVDARLVIVPGAFYREFPHTGADGRLLRREAEQLGLATDVIPIASTGTLDDNAATINQWLAQQDGRPMLLASVSKGGSDVKRALARTDAELAFRDVIGWINVAGLLDGSPMVNWLLNHRLRCWSYRAMFRLRRYDFRVIEQLRYGDGQLAAPLELPRWLRVVHLLGFPRRDHLHNRLTRTFHGRISHLGPNDGAIMLADACRWPGTLLPLWGADHYMRPSWELRPLAAAVIEYLATETIPANPTGA